MELVVAARTAGGGVSYTAVCTAMCSQLAKGELGYKEARHVIKWGIN